MWKYIKENKMSVVLVLLHIASVLLNIDNIRAAFAWVIATMWAVAFLGMENETKNLLSKYRSYVRELHEKIENLKSKVPAELTTKE